MRNKVLLTIFFVTNFSALYIGSILMNDGPKTSWYLNLNKAPWSPPDWMFGVVWLTIMLLFSIYMSKLCLKVSLYNLKLISIYSVQWILNVSWNYIFFNQRNIEFGFVITIILWLLIAYFTFRYLYLLKYNTILILPYLIWITIASSLNGYIVSYN